MTMSWYEFLKEVIPKINEDNGFVVVSAADVANVFPSMPEFVGWLKAVDTVATINGVNGNIVFQKVRNHDEPN